MAARQARRSWSLPAKPPEHWLLPVWTYVLNGTLTLCLMVPLLALPGRTVLTPRALALACALGAAAGAVGTYGLFVQAMARSEVRLRFVSVGFAVAGVAFLGRALAVRHDSGRAVLAFEVAGALALPVWTLWSRLAWRSWRLLAVPVTALGAGTAVALALDDARAVLAATAVTAAVALGRWTREQRQPEADLPWNLVVLALALDALHATYRMFQPGGTAISSVLLDTLPLVVPGLGLGLVAVLGYHQQVRRWRRLEEAARRLRTRTSLLPGRSITPDDVDGLPDPALVEVLVSGPVGLALQPVIDMRTGAVVGHEALARFGGREPTDRWFRAAVVHQLDRELELLTLTAALDQLHRLEPGQFLAVNVSPLALEDPRIRGLFVSHDLSQVLVEITEHDAVSDYDQLRTTLHALRDRGARIAVDDTGAGFSSLRHVLLLQPDIIKLDIALTRDATDPRSAVLIRSLVRFAREVGVELLAEGVEVRDQVQTLVDLGVRLGQGWHLGVPLTVKQPADPLGPRLRADA